METWDGIDFAIELRHSRRFDGRRAKGLLLSAIVDSAEDAVISVDVGGRVTSWAKGAERLYGIAAEQSKSAPLDQLLPSSAADLAKVRGRSTSTVTAYRETTSAYRGNVLRIFARLHHRGSYPGTGIKLATSERVVHAHGAPTGVGGGGISVWFTLPPSDTVLA